MNVDFGSQLPQGKTFALVLVVRTPFGEPKGTKYIESEHASDLDDFWAKNTAPKSRKKQQVQDKTTIVEDK
jgi:hypothetical protein